LVSMGALKDKTESFDIKKMTPKQAELFLKCWEHNINWGRNLMQEYFLTKSGVKGYSLRFLFSYGSNQATKLIRRCKEEYNYDLVTMIQDKKEGKTTMGPAPIRFVYKYLHQNR
ncbi:MAG: hypothetical protein NWF06_11265, partial [Candidatus Bathyarchaeota archaeon]|nr:hypothetical protein [Candidatus Bathyarchaeum sp.]